MEIKQVYIEKNKYLYVFDKETKQQLDFSGALTDMKDVINFLYQTAINYEIVEYKDENIHYTISSINSSEYESYLDAIKHKQIELSVDDEYNGYNFSFIDKITHKLIFNFLDEAKLIQFLMLWSKQNKKQEVYMVSDEYVYVYDAKTNQQLDFSGATSSQESVMQFIYEIAQQYIITKIDDYYKLDKINKETYQKELDIMQKYNPNDLEIEQEITMSVIDYWNLIKKSDKKAIISFNDEDKMIKFLMIWSKDV